MRVFGRRISKWWLFLPVVVLVVCAPILLMGFFAANLFAGAVIGPPAIWNRPFHTPSRGDLAGRYVESERHWDRPKTGPDAELELKGDGSMTVSALPASSGDFGTDTCMLSGSGTWRGSDQEQSIDLVFTSDGTRDTCKSGGYFSVLQIGSRSKPYDLYWVLGDPDSGTGIWLKRND